MLCTLTPPMTDTVQPAPVATARGPVQQAIFARRSIRKFTADPVDRAILARLLDASTQAPNHRLTRPWRFFVLDRPGSMRQQLTDPPPELTVRCMPAPHDAAGRSRSR